MSEWIELNLPYSYYEICEYPDQPNLNDKIKERFGKLPEDVLSSLKKPEDPEFQLDWTVFIKFYKLCDKNMSKKDILKIDDEDIQSLMSYFSFKNKVEDWYYRQPEVKEWDHLCNEIQDNNTKVMSTKSFSGLGLNKPGVLIEVEQDGKDVQYLIGDINTNRGVCNDCIAFDDNTIIKRYKVVWEK